MYIYKITNKINGKFYIGKTEKPDVGIRWQQHIRDSKYHNTKLYNAIKKYGPENFEVEWLESTGKVGRQRLNEREKYWIEVLEPEYNMTKGGDGGWINDQTGKTWKIKNTTNMKKKKTITQKVLQGHKKISGGNNYQSKYIIHTPWGVFTTWLDAVKAAKEEKRTGNFNVLITQESLQKYCLHNSQLNKEGKRTPKEWRGKFTRDLGFYVEEKNE